MNVTEPWRPDVPENEIPARQEAYQRLIDAARRLGLPRERLAALLRKLESNEEATRRLLAEEVYGVSDALLDDLIRVHLDDLERDG